MSTNFIKRLNPLKASLLLGVALTSVDSSLLPRMGHAHGGGGTEPLEAGEFRLTPQITVEAHGGFENNIEGKPEHYGLDGLFGGLMEWGLENGGKFSIEGAFGPVGVWGEAEHFYGAVHSDHDDHDDHDDHEEEHAEHDTDYKREDFRGYLKATYAPNDRLSVAVDTQPYIVTKNQGEEKKGTKNSIGAKALYAFGEGDVNFALGDNFKQLIDGAYVSLEHRQGWDSVGEWQGNYTDPRVGVEFNYDLIALKIEGGPRFFVPSSEASTSERTDFAGEIEIGRPVGENAYVFIHWQPTRSDKDGSDWGEGWQHHVGTGVTFTF